MQEGCKDGVDRGIFFKTCSSMIDGLCGSAGVWALGCGCCFGAGCWGADDRPIGSDAPLYRGWSPKLRQPKNNKIGNRKGEQQASLIRSESERPLWGGSRRGDTGGDMFWTKTRRRRRLAEWRRRGDRGRRGSSRGSASVESVCWQPPGSFTLIMLQVLYTSLYSRLYAY